MAEADPGARGASILRLDEFRTVALDRAHLTRHKIVGLNSADSRSRAFNLLRTRFAKSVEDAGVQLIGITSPTPAAGKSFLSVNLALSLAKVAAGPVYLLDLDLRRASVAEELGLETEVGINDYLAERVQSLEEVGIRIEGLPLVIFPTGRVDMESAELLSSPNFDRLLQRFRNLPSGTIVLCDLPPAFASDDAMISIDKMDGYVLVVDSSLTNKSHILDTLAMFEPKPCIGTVLNRFLGGLLDKYGYGSGDYGKYYRS
jgi:protein-tyrosine kinase